MWSVNAGRLNYSGALDPFFFLAQECTDSWPQAAPGLGNDGEYKFGQLRRATSKEMQKYDLM